MVYYPGQYEEQVAQSVQVYERLGTDRPILFAQRNNPPLASSADRTCDVQRGTGWATPWQNKAFQGRKLSLEAIDVLLQTRNKFGCNARNFQIFSLFVVRSCQIGTENEEFTLDSGKEVVDVGGDFRKASDKADVRIELVDAPRIEAYGERPSTRAGPRTALLSPRLRSSYKSSCNPSTPEPLRT